MRDRYEPPTDPEPWPTITSAYPVPGADDGYSGYDWDPDYQARSDGPADEARDQGLRRLSMLTLHATGLSVVTAIGFATVFATTAHAQTGIAVTAKPSPGPATASGTPSRFLLSATICCRIAVDCCDSGGSQRSALSQVARAPARSPAVACRSAVAASSLSFAE